MWKLSFLKYGYTHLISSCFKIGRWLCYLFFLNTLVLITPLVSFKLFFFFFRKIIMLTALVNLKGCFTHNRNIKFFLTKWAFCFALTTSHIQPSFYIQDYLIIWSKNGCCLSFSQAKSTFSNIWGPITTPFNAQNCSTWGNQSIHPVAYFYK